MWTPRINQKGPLPSERLWEGLRSRVGLAIVGGVGSLELCAWVCVVFVSAEWAGKVFVVVWVVGVGT